MKRGRHPARVELRHPRGMLSSEQVVEQTGITYRQLDYWTRRGWLEPAEGGNGSGDPRRWAPAVVDHVFDLLGAIRECPYDHGLAQE